MAVAKFTPKGGGFTEVSAIASKAGQDELARRLEVIDFFGWSNRARVMARKFKWKLTVVVD